MKNNFLKILIILLVILLAEVIVFFVLQNYQTNRLRDQFTLKSEMEKLNQEKEKKTLEDEFEKNKYLATGKNAYERIYNNKQSDILDLIQKLALEAFPNNWKIDVKAEEFTNFILLAQVNVRSKEPAITEIIKYLVPVLDHSGGYLKNVAIYNKKHKCYLFFDEDILSKIVKNQNLSKNIINEAKRKGMEFSRYNAIKISFHEKYGHIFVKVIVIGKGDSYEVEMMLDTGASMTVISSELAQKTGYEDLNGISRRTFSTAKGLMSCPIVQREIIVGDIYKKQAVAVNLEDDSNLLGMDFFGSREYIIDNPSQCIYIWNK
jgi:clan AA aspartic protease (TIGR02281 family)